MAERKFQTPEVPRFEREFFEPGKPLTRIGDGSIGGKTQGLAFARDLLASEFGHEFEDVDIAVPTLTVLGTDIFDSFMRSNGLHEISLSGDPDDRIAHAFQQAELPVEVVGDLRAVVERVHSPLAVRSSSLLEDAMFRPFAGVYETKMTPNNQPDPATRFRRLLEAIKYVYASTYFGAAKDYIRATDEDPRSEKMAVIIQEVVGTRHGDRFYPDLSGVCRSYDYYPTGRTRPEEGVVNLALGLGKAIVDGGVVWSYCPARPRKPPPFGSTRDLLRNTQTTFWSVNMGQITEYDPIAETEYLSKHDLAAADYDNTLRLVASTYDAQSDRLSPGVGVRGPRVLNFAPLLGMNSFGFNDLLRRLLAACEGATGTPVEIEFAMTFPHAAGRERARLGFLQVRPMVVSDTEVDVSDVEISARDALVASTRVMGNGTDESIRDIVYVKPDVFDARHTRVIAQELQQMNAALLAEGRPYLLIGFGRWGSSDPWLGIPVVWGQICGARAIVEATLPNMLVDPSQGSHFFHNISNFQVSYFTVREGDGTGNVDFGWLAGQAFAYDTEFVRHVRLDESLLVKVDGRTGRGVILRRA
ncbi:MAG: PEP/pyruvate-binding domain-containing protein [Planctomycetota bacterium]